MLIDDRHLKYITLSLLKRASSNSKVDYFGKHTRLFVKFIIVKANFQFSLRPQTFDGDECGPEKCRSLLIL